MIFITSLTIPANTPKHQPYGVYSRLNIGTIISCDIAFPAGCVGLAGCSILGDGGKIIPTNANDWIVGDNEIVKFNLSLDIRTYPTFLFIQGYNLDDTYNHTLNVRLNMGEKQLSIHDFLSTEIPTPKQIPIPQGLR